MPSSPLFSCRPSPHSIPGQNACTSMSSLGRREERESNGCWRMAASRGCASLISLCFITNFFVSSSYFDNWSHTYMWILCLLRLDYGRARPRWGAIGAETKMGGGAGGDRVLWQSLAGLGPCVWLQHLASA
jgi:hypothetical protein